jgi:hypothetical protein
MEIHSLKLVVAEDEINQLLTEHLPADVPVEKMRVRLAEEGVYLSGEYPALMVKVPFETRWELAVAGGVVRLRLATISVVGVPAGLLRGFLLKSLKETTADEPGVRVCEDSVEIDVEAMARAKKVTLKANLTAMRCGTGGLVIEAGHHSAEC